MTQTTFKPIFERLRAILKNYAPSLDCTHDLEDNYYLNTRHLMKNKKPLYFGSVAIKKNYVSYHLMPVYVHPELLDTISSELKKRMQGKSCFHFKADDQRLFAELSDLTAAGFHRYRQARTL